MGRNINYSYQHLCVGIVTSSRWLSGESSEIVIRRYIKNSGSNYVRKVSKKNRICRQGVAVVVLGVWIMYT